MIHTFHISLTIIVTPDFSSAIDPAPGARSKSDEKSGVTIMVNEIMRGVNHSQYGKVLHLLGASPRAGLRVGAAEGGFAVWSERLHFLDFGAQPTPIDCILIQQALDT